MGYVVLDKNYAPLAQKEHATYDDAVARAKVAANAHPANAPFRVAHVLTDVVIKPATVDIARRPDAPTPAPAVPVFEPKNVSVVQTVDVIPPTQPNGSCAVCAKIGKHAKGCTFGQTEKDRLKK